MRLDALTVELLLVLFAVLITTAAKKFRTPLISV